MSSPSRVSKVVVIRLFTGAHFYAKSLLVFCQEILKFDFVPDCTLFCTIQLIGHLGA